LKPQTRYFINSYFTDFTIERSCLMKSKKPALLTFVLLISLLVLFCGQAIAAPLSFGTSSTAPLFTTKDWQTVGELQGVIGSVYAMARDSKGNLYVGGEFTRIGGSATSAYNGIIMWNGSRWVALGEGLRNGIVYAIAIDSNDNVYAGGSFRASGNVTTDGLAKWDGTQWLPLWSRISDLSGANVNIKALHFDSHGNLYAGGNFRKIEILNSAVTLEASGIAVWNGAQWSAMGAGAGSAENSTYNTVEAIASDSSGNIYAGGRFSVFRNSNDIGDYITANGIASWDGSKWVRMGGSTAADSGVKYNHQSGIVYSMKMVGNTLYVGGWMTSAGGVSVSAIARWSGGSWSNPGFPQSGTCYSLTSDPAGNIYAGGGFDDGDLQSTRAFRYNGSQWTSLNEFYGDPARIFSLLAPANNELYIGGNYTSSSAFADTRYLSRRIDGKLEPLYYHVNGRVHTVIRAPNGDIYIGGEFSRAGDVLANNIARWDGTQWRAVGTIVGGPNGVNGPVYAIAVSPNGRVYAGGSFTTAAGTVSASNIAFFGTPPPGNPQIPQWQALGSGTNGTVRAFAFDANQRLVVGGDFSQAGGLTVNRIARWQSNQWSAISVGLNDSVRALAVDSAGIIYAGGLFTTAGVVNANRIAYFDTAWKSMGTGVNAPVLSLALDAQDNLYAGGSFLTAGGNTVNHIAMWNGSWQALGMGIPGQGHSVRTITVSPAGWIYAGGDFNASTDSPFNYTAVWNGSNWTSAGGELNKPVDSLVTDSYDNVYVGGQFNQIIPPTEFHSGAYYPSNTTSGFHFAFIWNRTMRIAGVNRYTTAVGISRQGWPNGANAVVLARGNDYPDALAAAPFAYLVNAPILLTAPSQLAPETLAEIRRLNPDTIYIIGGNSAVSESTENFLKTEFKQVTRIKGDNRYTTAISIADQMNVHGASFDSAFIVQGTNFPDALSAGAYAAMRGEPILLTPPSTLPPVLSFAMANLNIQNTFVIGGVNAVSANVFDQLPNPERISGSDRYLTSYELLWRFIPGSSQPSQLLDQIFISTGRNYPDAIAGGVLAAKQGTGLLLVNGLQSVPTLAQQNVFRTKKVKQAIFLGGSNSITYAQEQWVRSNLPLK
jgi:trimeric autotransporter adhesin